VIRTQSMHNVRASALLLLVVVASLAACGGSGGSSDSTTAPTTPPTSTSAGPSTSTPARDSAADTLSIKGFAFTAPDVAPGATITVNNEDGTTHTVTSDDGTSFDVKVGGHGSSTFTAPTKPGTYAFHCKIHSSMKGQLVVTG
jgi:plastocyanin